jgi:hypothetical protein|tara:strand:+ start:464 stop:688 length:225 start_codon:yes stop_codon:yes gene_type:complete
MAGRDYKSEYQNYHSQPLQKKNRAKRNLARRLMKRKLGNSINGKDIHHLDGNPNNNSSSNLRVVSKSFNRSRNA